MKALLGLIFALVVLAGCATAPRAANSSGLVDIGGGRELFLGCHGAGSPTVFIIPGKGSYAAGAPRHPRSRRPPKSAPMMVYQADTVAAKTIAVVDWVRSGAKRR